MSSPFVAAAICCGMVVGVTYGWNRLGRLPEVGTGPRARLAHELGGRSLTPPLMWAGATLLLVGLDVPHPVAVPVLAAVTLTWLTATAGRLLALISEVVRVREEYVGLLVLALAVVGWVWALSGRSPLDRIAVLLATFAVVAVGERSCSPALDVAVRARQIRSTGLRPVIVDDPAWRLCYVDVLPDRDSVCARYAGPLSDNWSDNWSDTSLWIDLLAPEDSFRPTELVRPWLWKAEQAGRVRYYTIVSGQRVRLEFDGGVRRDQEACRLVGRLRPASARQLAVLERGTA